MILDGIDIKGLTSDSRKVREGYLFAAFSGTKTDGTHFIEEAVKNGAVAIMALPGTACPDGVKLIEVDNPRQAFARLAASFYDEQPDYIVAVSGTNGKTSTVHFAQQIWSALGKRAASLGTLGAHGKGISRYGSMTTPDPASLHEELAKLCKAGVTHLAMESSSHGLDQHRLDGVHVKAAAFTNLTRDHLDYHPDMESYFNAKCRLFKDLLDEDGVAVLNADVDEYQALRIICKARHVKVISYGEKGDDIKLLSRKAVPNGQDVQLSVFGKVYNLSIPLVGAFQVMNSLCALGLVLAENMAVQDEAVSLLEQLEAPPGRVQLVKADTTGKEFSVYVDYAHTPDALENVLKALRPHTKNRLVCIVGCGGDRDPGKRPMMGKIANDLADLVVITDDNPRTEDPALIRKAMLETAPDAKEIGDRAQAILDMIKDLGDGDVLLIAGKGHEQGQIIGDRVEPFDDLLQAETAILALKETAQ